MNMSKQYKPLIFPREKPVYFIPQHVEVIFVSDFFVEDLLGGAELTTEALIEFVDKQVLKLYSNQLTKDLVAKNKNKIWIIANWANAPQDALASFVLEKCSYYCIEYDYKYCKFRSSHLHKLQTGDDCDCHNDKNFAIAFYKRAKHVFFMSENQRLEYISKFPIMKYWENTSVLSSVWSEKDLEFINFLSTKYSLKNEKWAILSGGSWIKNQKYNEEYCKTNNIPYDLIGGYSYRDFLEKLAQYYGLVFMPAGYDTCPRVVVEAKLLGLQLKLGDNVQHKNEWWFNTDKENTLNYLRSANERFYSKIF